MNFVRTSMGDPMNARNFKSVQHTKVAEQVVRNHFDYLKRKVREERMDDEEKARLSYKRKKNERKNRVSENIEIL